MAGMTLSEILSRAGRKIQNASSKLGGQTEMIAIANEANRDIESRVDLISAKRLGAPRLIMNNIWQYPIDSDISYDKMIEALFDDEDSNAHKSEFQRSPAKFMFNMKNPFNYNGYVSAQSSNFNDSVGFSGSFNNDYEEIAIDFLNGDPFLMVKMKHGESYVLLNNLDTYNDNGTWTAVGDATGIRTDNQSYAEGSGAVAFDSTGATTSCGVENSTMTAVDLTDYENKGRITVWVYCPDTNLTSVGIRWGSDASNYFSATATVAQNGLPFITGWNLVGFDWGTNITQVGTPTVASIGYLYAAVNYTTGAAAYNYRFDGFYARQGRQCKLNYYSKHLVISDAGVRKENFTLTDDRTILREKEVNMLIWSMVRIANQQLRQYNEADRYENELERMIADYKTAQPSQDEPSFMPYYIM